MCTGCSPNIRATEATRCPGGVWSRFPGGIIPRGHVPGSTALPPPRQNDDRRLWKHYLLAASLEGGKNRPSENQEVSLGPAVNVQRCVVYVRILSCDWISGRVVSPKAIVFPTGDVPFYVAACLEVALLQLYKLKTIICEKIEWRTGWVRSFV